MFSLLSDKELERQWRQKILQNNDNIDNFIERYDLNRGNFNKWLQHKRGPGTKARECVIAYLEGRDADEQLANKLEQLKITNNHKICKYYVAGYCDKGVECKYQHKLPDDKHYLEIELMRKNVISSYKHVYFIDYENSPSVFDISPTIFKENSAIIIFSSIKGPKLPQLNSDMFVIRTLTCAPQAADHAITLEIGVLDYLVDKSVEFHIVTKDYFATEVVARIKCLKRYIDMLQP